MNLDARVKRYFPFIVLGMLAVAAYFQASGVARLIASSVEDDGPPAPATASSGAAGSDRTGAPILARNPFDSVTGSLGGGASAEPSDEPESPEDDAPAAAGGKCDFGHVALIIASGDPRFSFASIAGSDGKARICHLGDSVDGHVVTGVSWDRVTFGKGASRCHLMMGDGATPKKPVAAAPRRHHRYPGLQLPGEIAGKIHKVSDTEFQVERSAVEEILDKQTQLMAFTHMRPVKRGDEVVGLRLSRVPKGSLLDVLGLKTGDQLRSINGFPLTDPQKALEAYGRLKTADKLSVAIVRGGRSVTIDFDVQ